jgi:benzoyl-CoA reductase subunit A
MTLVLGLDLGSTTCKAVILDRDGHWLGRGLTHTRSHYAMAIAVATEEALSDAGIAQLVRAGILDPAQTFHHAAVVRLAELRHRHAALLSYLLDTLGGAERERLAHLGQAVAAGLESREAGPGFPAGDPARAFGDLVTEWYLAVCAERDPFATDWILRLLDQTVARVDNQLPPLPATVRLQALLDAAGVTGADPGPLTIQARVGTGYGRQRLPFPADCIRSEILCHARGMHQLFPGVRTLLDIGGQDTKAIQLDDRGLVSGFAMNDRCAAGCGRYLGYVAEELGVSPGELGQLACAACRPVPVTSTCTVFASAELRGLLHAGERTEEVLLGAHRAILLRAFSLLARSGGVRDEFAMTGGVALNPAIRRLLGELMPRYYPGVTVRFHPDSIYMGAYGAALQALEKASEQTPKKTLEKP